MWALIALLFISCPSYAANHAAAQHPVKHPVKHSKPATASSTGSQLLGTFGAWHAFATHEKEQKLCYAALVLHTKSTKAFPRSDARLTITHRPAENSLDVVSYASGYNFRPATDVKASIGKNSFALFTAQDTAWSRDAMTDHKITKALQNAATASFTGTPTKQGAKPITDHFNLKGATDAYRAISKACGLPVAEEKSTVTKGKKTTHTQTPHKSTSKKPMTSTKTKHH